MSTASEQCSTPRVACYKSTTQYKIFLCIVWIKLCFHLHHFCNGDILAWAQVRPDSHLFWKVIGNKQTKLCMIIVLLFIRCLWKNICIQAQIFAWMKNYPHWNQTRLFDISTEINLASPSAKGLWAQAGCCWTHQIDWAHYPCRGLRTTSTVLQKASNQHSPHKWLSFLHRHKVANTSSGISNTREKSCPQTFRLWGHAVPVWGGFILSMIFFSFHCFLVRRTCN